MDRQTDGQHEHGGTAAVPAYTLSNKVTRPISIRWRSPTVDISSFQLGDITFEFRAHNCAALACCSMANYDVMVMM